jgi:hypothetical protein
VDVDVEGAGFDDVEVVALVALGDYLGGVSMSRVDRGGGV